MGALLIEKHVLKFYYLKFLPIIIF